MLKPLHRLNAIGILAIAKPMDWHSMAVISRYISIILFCAFCSVASQAKEYRFTAAVNRAKVPLNRSFQLTFSFEGGRPQRFNAPDLSAFRVVGGPSQGVNQSWVNGSYTQSFNFTYELKPKKEGVFIIGPAEAGIGDKVFQSNSLKVTVTKSKGGGGEIYEQIAENLYLKAFASKRKVYQGEQLKVTFKMYKRLDVSNMAVGSHPKYEGFWKEDYLSTEDFELKQEVINGERWQTGVLESVILFPQKTGKVTIDPFVLDVKVPVRASRNSRDPFDDFFGRYKQYDYQLKSPPISVEVLPLPAKGKPKNFSGLVGSFDFKADLTTSETEANESVTLRLKVAGSGNVKLVKPWQLSFPADIEQYDPKTKESFSNKNGVFSGKREFEYLLIPRREGTYKLPQIEFSYFDVEKKSYVTFSETDLVLKAGKGESSISYSEKVPKGISKEDISILNEDIRYISLLTSLQTKGYRFASSPMFLSLAGAPAFLFALLIAFRRRQEASLKDVEGTKKRKATSLAKKRLKNARGHLQDNEPGQFYEEISKALFGYLEDKLSLDKASMSKDRVINELMNNGISEDLRSRLSAILDACEFARFAPGSGKDLSALYEKSESLITELEGALR